MYTFIQDHLTYQVERHHRVWMMELWEEILTLQIYLSLYPNLTMISLIGVYFCTSSFNIWGASGARWKTGTFRVMLAVRVKYP